MFAIRQCVEILPCLFEVLAEIVPGAHLFEDRHTGPKQVDEARAVVELGDMRLVAGHVPPPHSEYAEEGVIEALRLTLLVGRAIPVLDQGGGAGADPVPRKVPGLERFFVEVVFVDPLDLVTDAGPHADSMPDHHVC